MSVQTEKKQSRMLIYRLIYTIGLGVVVLMLIMLYLRFSYGWFASNDAVTADGMQVSANDESFFELAVRDRNTTTPADPNLDQHSPYANDSDIVVFLAQDEYGGYAKINETDNDNPALLCHLVNENPHEENSEDLAPGAFGVISFDIVLAEGTASDFDIDLSFFPLGETVVNNARVPCAIVDPDETDPAVIAEQEEKLATLREYLSGHILFFQSRSAKQNGGYYYSDRLTTDSFVFELPAQPDYTANGKDYYTVEIYWIWPATFGQLALPNSDARVHVHSVYNDETARGEMLDFISDNPGKFFRELSVAANTVFARADYEDYYFVELSEGYNRADQMIGDSTQYLIVCVDVSQHNNP